MLAHYRGKFSHNFSYNADFFLWICMWKFSLIVLLFCLFPVKFLDGIVEDIFLRGEQNLKNKMLLDLDYTTRLEANDMKNC